MTEWQPMETAPKDGTRVLVDYDGNVTIGEFLTHGRPWAYSAWWIEGGQMTCNPTAWMPLPLPKKEQA